MNIEEGYQILLEYHKNPNTDPLETILRLLQYTSSELQAMQMRYVKENGRNDWKDIIEKSIRLRSKSQH
ncbi:MAG: hypothetical protein ABIF10_01600 [Candidatus Woesearchaeota archaeon]